MINKLDAKGLICPEPIMLLHKAIKEAKHGDRVEVFATDPTTERDIEKFCVGIFRKFFVFVRTALPHSASFLQPHGISSSPE